MKYLLSMFLIGAFFTQTLKAASTSENIGVAISVSGDQFKDGFIVCSRENNFAGCNIEYSQNISGVISEKPALYIDNDTPGSMPLTTNGKAFVLVTSTNGNIKKGDYITTSKVPGVGMKATHGGNVVGVALEAFENDDKTALGKIGLLVDIQSVVFNEQEVSLVQALKQGFSIPRLSLLGTLRYWLAILISIVTFTIGFVYFGKVSKSGVEAMGRNPLAGKMIQLNLFLNMGFIVLIMIGGLALAYAIVVV